MEDSLLLCAVVRFTECVSERPVEEEHARGFHLHRQFPHQCQRNRRHTTGFDLTCEQSHGSRADRSGRYQERQVDVGLRHKHSDLMPRFQQVLRILDETKAVMGVCDSAYDAACFQFQQPF